MSNLQAVLEADQFAWNILVIFKYFETKILGAIQHFVFHFTSEVPKVHIINVEFCSDIVLDDNKGTVHLPWVSYEWCDVWCHNQWPLSCMDYLDHIPSLPLWIPQLPNSSGWDLEILSAGLQILSCLVQCPVVKCFTCKFRV